MTARNKQKFADGHAIRDALRLAMGKLQCPYCGRHPPAKVIVAEVPKELQKGMGDMRHHIHKLKAKG